MQPWIPIPSLGSPSWELSLGMFIEALHPQHREGDATTQHCLEVKGLSKKTLPSSQYGRRDAQLSKHCMAAPLLMSLAGCIAHPKVPCRVFGE